VTCRPGHAPRHPDFGPGNAEAETHGAHRERRWRPLAEELATEALAVAPWLSRPAFRLALEAWSVAEAKARLVDRWLDEHGLLTAHGVPRPANALADRLHARAQSLRAQCGLDPTAFARLLATFSLVPDGAPDALAALRAEGARLIAARSAALPSGVPEEAS